MVNRNRRKNTTSTVVVYIVVGWKNNACPPRVSQRLDATIAFRVPNSRWLKVYPPAHNGESIYYYYNNNNVIHDTRLFGIGTSGKETTSTSTMIIIIIIFEINFYKIRSVPYALGKNCFTIKIKYFNSLFARVYTLDRVRVSYCLAVIWFLNCIERTGIAIGDVFCRIRYENDHQ